LDSLSHDLTRIERNEARVKLGLRIGIED